MHIKYKKIHELVLDRFDKQTEFFYKYLIIFKFKLTHHSFLLCAVIKLLMDFILLCTRI